MLQECLKFLKEIHYGGSQDFSTKPFYPSNAFSNIYLETASTFLKVLWKNSSSFTSKFILLCEVLSVMLCICLMDSMFNVLVNARFLDLMWVLLLLLNYLKKWRSCMVQFRNQAQSCKMVELQMCLQQKDMQKTLRPKLIRTFNKCFLVN